ncbi:ABC transporter ATP-binding protein [Microvirga arsenatis]|uniref:ATP-binding cassette domain-containing protein n=1 Tax=Microvirga arsenatis TaxID=2692265 RepID=A0ABW9Z0F3_9HYPH|nr:ABC transporter ATP-binding protein [Microvirga arsenatis]NBJ11148.1 ATP-binding cassette domain-containing protein [Microvirga arsenatis]NBJ25421.1 ATP-binding cassette domain-containing protein [Microvirga arsenatis]
MSIVLEARQVSKNFGGFHAVRNVNLRVQEGNIHALIGPNGAGKTTLFGLLTRFHSASSGSIFLKGEDITAKGPAEVALRGLCRSFQISSIFPGLTLRDNVRVALQRRYGSSHQFWLPSRVLSRFDDEAEQLLDLVGLTSLAQRLCSEVSYGRKRALEIATTLAMQPKVLLLDEPIAGMAAGDVPMIVELIRSVAKDRTVVMVEHNLSVVESLCDKVTVLVRGEVMAEGTYREIRDNPAVREAYIGAGYEV